MPAGNPKVQAYNLAYNQVTNRTPAGPGLVQFWGTQPLTFVGPGFQPGDSDQQRQTVIDIVDRRTRPVTATSGLSELADVKGGLEREHQVLRQLHAHLTANPGLSEPGAIDERNAVLNEVFQGGEVPPQASNLLTTSKPKDLINRMADVQRMRTVNAHYKGVWPYKAGAAAVNRGLQGASDRPQVIERDAQGRPRLSLVGQGPPEPTPESEAKEFATNKNLVTNRARALRRYREGLPIGSDVETAGDQSLQDAESMLRRFQPGKTPPTRAEVEAFLESTETDYRTNPGAADNLHPGELELMQNDPDLFLSQFEMDEDGRWRRVRSTG